MRLTACCRVAGARGVLIPTENGRDFATLPAAVLDKLRIEFYSEPSQGAFKALAESTSNRAGTWKSATYSASTGLPSSLQDPRLLANRNYWPDVLLGRKVWRMLALGQAADEAAGRSRLPAVLAMAPASFNSYKPSWCATSAR